MTPTNNHALLLVSEAAKLLRLSRATVYELIRTRKIAGVKIGGSVRVYAWAVDAILNATPAGQLPFPGIKDAPRKA